MKHGARVAVVVPALNEACFIARTLRSVPDWVDTIVVVDDASTDGTGEVVLAVADPRVRLERHARNRGVGAALVTGYRAAFEARADVAAVMAGDGQMHPDDLEALIAPVLCGEADYVKGNRLDHASVRRDMPVVRRLGNQVLSWLTGLATGLRVRDSQCGYTALARTAAERLHLPALWPRYGYPNDLLGRVAAAGLRLREVVVRPVYGDERSGIRWWHATLVVPALLMRTALRRVLSRGLASLAMTVRKRTST